MQWTYQSGSFVAGMISRKASFVGGSENSKNISGRLSAINSPTLMQADAGLNGRYEALIQSTTQRKRKPLPSAKRPRMVPRSP
jgi:hypothetical protein